MSKTFTKPLESATRKKIDQWLFNLGWNIDESSPTCNCFTERTRTEDEKRKLKGNFPDYVLYSSRDFKPLAIIEAKRQSGSLEKALKQAVEKYANPLSVNIVFVTDGIFIQAYHVSDADYLYYNAELVTDLISERRVLEYSINGCRLFSEQKITHTKVELISIFKDANDILRKDGLTEGKERFTEFSNLLFLKLMSDIESQKEELGEDRKLEQEYCWDYYKGKPAKELYSYIDDIVLKKINTKYNQNGTIFSEGLSIAKPENLKEIVDKISKLGNLLDTNSDIKGDAFEYFLKNSISVGNDLGEYFTPRHIVKLMVELLDLKFREKIYDPCCGTGGFLIEAFKSIKNKCKLTDEDRKILEEETVFGVELTNTARIAKMNMIIMGDGHNNIEKKDCLEHPVKAQYDAVLSNFAYSQKTSYGSYYGFDTEDANPIFLKHIFDSLKEKGKAAVVVPEGVLFDTKSEYIKIRKILVEQAKVIAIIRLHSFVFKPYTGQPTSIIIFEKGKKTEDVWFFDVKEDGFQKTGSKKGRKKIQQDDLLQLRQIWSDKMSTPNSFIVKKDTIVKNKYILTLGKYEDKIKATKTVKLKTLVKNGEIIIGYTPSRSDESNWFGGKNIWAKVADITGDMFIEDSSEHITDKAVKANKLLPVNTLLFSFKLTVGKVAITKKEMFTNEAIAGLVIDDPVVRKYLYYILPTLDYSTNRATKGDTLKKEAIGEIDVPFDAAIIEEIVKEMDAREAERERIHAEKKRIELEMRDYIDKMIEENC